MDSLLRTNLPPTEEERFKLKQLICALELEDEDLARYDAKAAVDTLRRYDLV